MMNVSPLAFVGASAVMQRTSGHNGEGLKALFEITESAPIPEKPCAAVPPLNSTQMSAAATPGIPFPFTSKTVTFKRALFGKLAPPVSLFGHTRKNLVASVPSTGAAVVPVWGTKNDFVLSGTPAVAGIATANNASDAMTTKETFHLSCIFILRVEGHAPDLGLVRNIRDRLSRASAVLRTRSADRM
ncbi:MAG TPA: hypothetical protein VJW75_06930 [Candidatus Eisenbacteria bacterium]|nr:hypothetical protein [Candidatus Eisenbacteria bacterium]